MAEKRCGDKAYIYDVIKLALWCVTILYGELMINTQFCCLV